MNLLSNDILVDSYYKAVAMHLDQEFIILLLDEIRKREIELTLYSKEAQTH